MNGGKQAATGEKMDDEGYEYDEGSDVDNWEAEQVFQDLCAEAREDVLQGDLGTIDEEWEEYFS